MPDGSEAQAFSINDCALIALATGQSAQNLKELRDNLINIHAGSIYFHFWGGLLQPRFEEREYNNDFAAWARHGLHDTTLAERLAVVDPTGFEDVEALRQELIDILEERLDESEFLIWARADEQFEFIRSQIVVFNTHKRLERAEQLASAVPQMSTSSIFYHFIDARRRCKDRMDDFRAWLSGFGTKYEDLSHTLAEIDPYFMPLTQIRDQLVKIFQTYFGVQANEHTS